MIDKEKAKELGKWTAGTGTASLIGILYLHGFIFPRTEADALVNRVDRIEPRIESRLTRIETKIDDIQLILAKKLAEEDQSHESTPPHSPVFSQRTLSLLEDLELGRHQIRQAHTNNGSSRP